MAGPFAQDSFEDQFEEAVGQMTFFDMSWEVPFNLLLTRASVFTNSSIISDAYLEIFKNGDTGNVIVAPGPVPPNRNLPAVGGLLKGLDLANIPCVQGDKITVRLHLPTGPNTLKRVKWVLAYACELVVPPAGIGYGYSP